MGRYQLEAGDTQLVWGNYSWSSKLREVEGVGYFLPRGGTKPCVVVDSQWEDMSWRLETLYFFEGIIAAVVAQWGGGGGGVFPALQWHQAPCNGGQSVGRYQLETLNLSEGIIAALVSSVRLRRGCGISCPALAPCPAVAPHHVWWWTVSGKISAGGWRHSTCLREL